MQSNLGTICYEEMIERAFDLCTEVNLSLMNHEQTFEEIAMSIASLDRQQVMDRILNFKGRFSMDFSPDYLDELSIDRLRHILLAALTTQLRRYRH